MKETLNSFIWNSFKRIYGPIGTIFTIVGSLFLWIFAPDTKISLKIILPILVFIIMLLFTFIDTTYQAIEKLKQNKNILPKILRVMDPRPPYQKAKALALLEKSPIFSFGTIVGIYFIEDDFEQLIGIGEVINIQENKKIQIAITSYLEGQEDKIEELLKNNARLLEKTIVKPYISFDIVELFYRENLL